MSSSNSSMQTALAAADGRPSGFDYMRIILSIAVLGSHSVSSSYGREAAEILWDGPARGFLRTILPMFFALSGFLVAGSMERCRTLVKFLGLRAIRIYPPLAVEVLLSAFLIGPLVTSVPIGQYFTDPQFLRYLVNITGHITFFLPGVFETNPNPQVVNGQLWTVPFELYCYIFLAGLIFLGAKRYRFILPLGTFALLATIVGYEYFKSGWILHEYYRVLGGPLLVVIFLLGVNFYIYREYIPHSGLLCVFMAIVSLIALGLVPHGAYFAIFSLTYVTAYLGLCNPRRIKAISGADYSYGLFLYGYVVQQLIMHLFPSAREWYWNLIICLPLATGVAALSWYFVEEPAMKLRKFVDIAEQKYFIMKERVFRKERRNFRSC